MGLSSGPEITQKWLTRAVRNGEKKAPPEKNENTQAAGWAEWPATSSPSESFILLSPIPVGLRSLSMKAEYKEGPDARENGFRQLVAGAVRQDIRAHSLVVHS